MSTNQIFNESELLELKRRCVKNSKTKDHNFQIEQFQQELKEQAWRVDDIVEATAYAYGVSKGWAKEFYWTNNLQR